MAVREIAYDEVFDGQEHFRSILDSMARPGKINRLSPTLLNPPPGLNAASVLVAFALMDEDSAFAVVNMDRGEAAYLSCNTNARAREMENAHFIFADAAEPPEFLDTANCGTLLYPETAAILILQVTSASAEPLRNALQLTLEGPGIDGTKGLSVRGMSADLLLALQARNTEFPLGLDAILTFADASGAPSVAALPRTTRVVWGSC